MAKTRKFGFLKKRRTNRQKSQKNQKRQRRQRGGALKEDALKVLAANQITDLEQFLFSSGKFVINKEGTSYNDVIYGDYTFRKTRDMSRTYHLIAFITSSPESHVTLLSVNDY